MEISVLHDVFHGRRVLGHPKYTLLVDIGAPVLLLMGIIIGTLSCHRNVQA